MIGRLLLAGLLLLTACTARDEAQPRARPALWEVSGPGGNRGWVFGTVHALPRGLAWWSPTIESALGHSDRLVLELAEDAGNSAGARATFLRLATTPGLPPLAERVRPDLRDELAALTATGGTDPRALAAMEDWAAAMTLATGAAANSGLSPALGAEPALRAHAGPRPVDGLETVAGQLSLFDRLEPEAQSALLDATLVESADPAQGERLIRTWARGDTAALARETHAGMLAEPRLRRALLVERNQAWAARVDAMLRHGQRPFVAVGAAHVVGDDGLPALLQRRGWQVRRVQ